MMVKASISASTAVMGSGGVAAASVGSGTARVDVTLKLSQLQNMCKRDPEGYREDYEAQVRRLESELGILRLQPATAGSTTAASSSSPHSKLEELIQFAAAVSSSSYKGKESDRIANLLMSLLVGGEPVASSSPSGKSKDVLVLNAMPAAALQLHRDIRKSTVSALILMRNKGVIEPLKLLELFFRIMAVVPDKTLREILYRHIVNDVRNMNKKGKREDKVNRAVQSFLHRVVATHGTSTGDNQGATSMEESATDIAAKRATDMVCELYRRRVWTDDRTVAILASAAQSKNTTVMCRALRFFLNIEEKMAQDTKIQKEEDWETKNRVDYHSHSKKTAARRRHVERQVKLRKKARAKRDDRDANADWMDADPDDDQGVEASKKLYPAIEMLRDPQGLAEAIFKRLKAVGSYKYETKLLMMNFITRLVGNHELLILPLYSFLTKYLAGGHQRNVTAVLAYTVQACHEHIPPDQIYLIMKTIAHNFVTERCSEEQIAVGINAIRAICTRVPSVMSEEESKESTDATGEDGFSGSGTAMDIEAFARDIAAFSNHRDRSVSIAGKSWTNFVREVNPGLLRGRDRGLKGTGMHKAGVKPLRYGEQRVAVGVEGADLLAEYEAKKQAARRRGKKQEKTEGADDDEDGEEKWETVEGDGEGDDSDDESAPDLVVYDDGEGKEDKETEDGGALDVSKMSPAERDKLKQEMSSTRIFTSSDFIKMRKLVEREQRARRDPREAARRKRAVAKGEDFDALSGDDSDGSSLNGADESDDDQVHIRGAVNPMDIMAMSRKKRQNKAEKLEKVIAGRSKFESKRREGGATNVEKKRTKNFLMSRFSREARAKGKGKGHLQNNKRKKQLNHEAKKRRRKL